MEKDFDNIESPKSPKSPKLSEEVQEMTLKSPLNESEKHEDCEENVIIDVEAEDHENNTEFDEVKEILKKIFETSPAGQVQNVSSICKDLFKNLPNFIEKESRNKLIKDGYIVEDKFITEDNCEEFEEDENVKKDDEENKEDESVKDEFKKEISEKIEKYLNEFYPETGKFLITKTKAKEYKIRILAEKIKSKAFWSGRWSSVWRMAYQQLSENIFKKLRRHLPVTRTKMDWAKFANYNLSTELKK